MSAPSTERTFRVTSVTTTVDVDVDIDEALLEENGYHHEDDCPSTVSGHDGEDLTDDLRALSDWHDNAHGLSLWANCQHEPCNLLSDEFRSTP
ncbi:hypothetical protein PP637_gp72 [Arthrobacter phage Persistence]|uniref:Uncharacterized protein n=1 Tax=Arthrobacter phage Persistence TaxID=2836007 RepID=A0A8F3E1Y6_9CAUD|nr:hypothetical protein PP637_gp72 [Arthrobacter phage Persistence]QWY79700.1 hypothetical protein SEA_PERSISTENCE_72 [Arthrobacter phage Persistence]